MPFGIGQFNPPRGDVRFGIVMKCDDTEVFAIKQQPIEIDKEAALRWQTIQHTAWSIFADGGVEGVFHIPAVPLEISKAGLRATKGASQPED